jgi:hypothetical protein
MIRFIQTRNHGEVSGTSDEARGDDRGASGSGPRAGWVRKNVVRISESSTSLAAPGVKTEAEASEQARARAADAASDVQRGVFEPFEIYFGW